MHGSHIHQRDPRPMTLSRMRREMGEELLTHAPGDQLEKATDTSQSIVEKAYNDMQDFEDKHIPESESEDGPPRRGIIY